MYFLLPPHVKKLLIQMCKSFSWSHVGDGDVSCFHPLPYFLPLPLASPPGMKWHEVAPLSSILTKALVSWSSCPFS